MAESMEISPLQLKQIVFTQVLIELSAGIEQAKEIWAPDFDMTGVEIRTQVETAIEQGTEEDPKTFIVRVNLTIPNEMGKAAPYKVGLDAYGVFELAPVYPVNKRQGIIYVNGASIIVGAMREMITMFTSRAAFGAFTLPTLRFIPPSDAVDQPVAKSQ